MFETSSQLTFYILMITESFLFTKSKAQKKNPQRIEQVAFLSDVGEKVSMSRVEKKKHENSSVRQSSAPSLEAFRIVCFWRWCLLFFSGSEGEDE